MAKRVSLQALRALLKSVDGKHETPPGSNRIFVWTDLIRWKLAAAYFNGQSYCAGGIVWTLRKLGLPIPDVSSPYYCPSRVQWFRAHGRYRNIRAGKAGDEVYYAWTASAQRSGLAEHVGRLVQDVKPGDRTIRTFEFNTSSGTAGSQANGDGCFFRTRPIDATILGVGGYHVYFTEGGGEALPKTVQKGNPYAKALRAARLPLALGARGDAVRAVQWAVGVPVDGIFGHDTDHAVRVFQRYHTDNGGKTLVSDGEVGRLTRQRILEIKHPKH